MTRDEMTTITNQIIDSMEPCTVAESLTILSSTIAHIAFLCKISTETIVDGVEHACEFRQNLGEEKKELMN